MDDLRRVLAKSSSGSKQEGMQGELDRGDIMYSKAAAWAWLLHKLENNNSPAAVAAENARKACPVSSRFKAEATRTNAGRHPNQRLFDHYELTLVAKAFQEAAAAAAAKRKMNKRKARKGVFANEISWFSVLIRPSCFPSSSPSSCEKTKKKSRSKADGKKFHRSSSKVNDSSELWRKQSRTFESNLEK